MKQSVFVWLVVCGVCAGVAQDAQAQGGTWADRGYINIGFGVESGSSTLTETANLIIYEESATITAPTNWTSGSRIDAGFGPGSHLLTFTQWEEDGVLYPACFEVVGVSASLNGSLNAPLLSR